MTDFIVGVDGLENNPTIPSVTPPIQWAVTAGTGAAYSAAYATPNTALTDGLCVAFRAHIANSSTTPTFAPDGLTPHTITKHGGAALVSSPADIALAGEYLVRYNLANTRWELLNPVN